VTGNFDYENGKKERTDTVTTAAAVCIFFQLIFWWSEQKFNCLFAAGKSDPDRQGRRVQVHVDTVQQGWKSWGFSVF
jgi:hypothetical protein